MSDRTPLALAEDAFHKQDYATAEAILHPLVAERVPFADAYSLLGMIKYQQGYFAQAIEHLEKAVSINPHYCEALMYLSVIQHDLGRYSKGKKHEAKLTALPKGDGLKRLAPPFRAKLANLHAEIGDVYRGLGCYPEAKIEYDHALALEQYPDIRLKHALCLRGMDKDSRDAVTELQKLIKECPKYVLAYLELGTTHYLQKNTAAAKAMWQKVVAIQPGNEPAAVYLKLLARRSSAASLKKIPPTTPKKKRKK